MPASQAKSSGLKEKSRSLDVMTFNMSQPALIEASAGTGKTYTITNLVLRALLGVGKDGTTLARPLQLEEMLIVTFTNAATADLRKRVYNRIRDTRIYLEHFLDFSLEQILLALHQEGVSDAQQTALWESKSGRAKTQALILCKKKQLQFGHVANDDELHAIIAASEGKSLDEVEAEFDSSLAADAATGVGTGADQDAEALSSSEAETELYKSSSFSSDELDQIFVELRVDKLIKLAQDQDILGKDAVQAEILTNLLQRASVLARSELVAGGKITEDDSEAGSEESFEGPSVSLLRNAIQILMRAERSINNAAICTIHSFCNTALTQIYALEAGEAFNTSLKLELQHEIHEACYTVWRRLFYKKNSSKQLLSDLYSTCSREGAPVNDPLSFYQKTKTLNAVRLSDRNDGFFGYQLLGIEELLQECNLELDREQPLEPQVVAYIARLDAFMDQLYTNLVDSAQLFVTSNPLSKFAAFYDFEQQCFTSNLLSVCPKLDSSADSRAYLSFIPAFYSLLDQVQQAQQELQQLQEQAAASAASDANSATAQALDAAVDKQQQKVKQFQAKLFASAKDLLADRDNPLRHRRKGGDAAAEAVAPLKMLVDELNTILAQVVGNNDEYLTSVRYLLRTLVSIVLNDEIDRICKDQHVMSADDVLRRLDFALNSRGALGKRLAWSIRARYPLAMIDEFQDTDPIQFNIFSAIYLNEEAMKNQAYCYLIGDPKQSIYAFRGSDINSYLKAKDIVLDLTQKQGLYTLDTNYRSAPDIVYASNAIFDTWFNFDNVNPFDEANIQFSSVFSKLEKEQGGKKTATPNKPAQPEFVFGGVEELLFYPPLHKNIAFGPLPSAQSELSSEDKAPSVPSFKPTNTIEDDAANAEASEKKGEEWNSPFLGASRRGNTYIVDVGETDNKGKLNERYALATAQIVQRLLQNGKLGKEGKRRAVVPGDIAILVRSAAENDLIQQKLWELQIPSVYFSDNSSVLGNGETPSAESIELSYLMEAMCDCTNRNKVSRVLGSRLLSLSTEEFLQLNDEEHFEREVQLLNQCAQTWKRFGFLPAFLQWGNYPDHKQSERLLQLKDGERLYTNYCHISEIIQNAHQQKGGLAAQLHWFYELIYKDQSLFEQDITQKRLESEKEQIKILTIHKSKGLEFPIVLMPFLWSTQKKPSGKNDYYGTTKYYDAGQNQHTVLDFNPERELEVTQLVLHKLEQEQLDGKKWLPPLNEDDIPVDINETNVAANPFNVGNYGSMPYAVPGRRTVRYLKPTKTQIKACELSAQEEQREHARLLYVAITRAKYANFLFVGKASKAQGEPTSLAYLQGIVGNDAGDGKADPDKFMLTASFMSEIFTVVNGLHLLPADLLSDKEKDKLAQELARMEDEDLPALKSEVQGAKGAPEGVPSEGLSPESMTPEGMNPESKTPESVPPYAISFLYKNAVDKSFNIFSYTSLVSHAETQRIYRSAMQSTGAASSEVPETTHLHDGANDSLYRELVKGAQEPRKATVIEAQYEPVPTSGKFSLGDSRYSLSALMQEYWQNNAYCVAGDVFKRFGSVSLDFPRGSAPGSFMHRILEFVDFELFKNLGWHDYLVANVMELLSKGNRGSDYYKMLRALSARLHTAQMEQSPTFKQRLGEWFNDVLEAPIVQGRYHCFALADLQPLSYEREMEFLMSNKRFNTKAIDEICRQVAKTLLPLKAQQSILPTLKLDGRELIGYCKGSIDLACRLDLNQHLALRLRPDLVQQMPEDKVTMIRHRVADLQQLLLEDDDEVRHLYGDAEINLDLEADEPDVKYFVIDYKSNYLGDSFASYDRDGLLASIYTHRYDVQFLIYTLALYRFLKRRMGVSFDASEQELRAFYDRHVGGVLYLYLRGLQANYLRDHISTGVFSTKIDFAVIHKLDQIFDGGH